MGENNFCTAQGIRISDLSGIHCAYETWKNETGWVFTAVLDAPRIPAFLQDYCALLPVPGYFTLELPAEEDGAYDIYYVRRMHSACFTGDCPPVWEPSGGRWRCPVWVFFA